MMLLRRLQFNGMIPWLAVRSTSKETFEKTPQSHGKPVEQIREMTWGMRIFAKASERRCEVVELARDEFAGS